jgi:hypothetical protein
LKQGADVPEENNGTPTVSDLGLSRKHIWQKS